VDEKLNRNIEGAGLGLSIASQLLQQMGSQLMIDSEYGVGSIFSFELTQQIADAAAFALKNMLGLACDPVGGLVEVPCIKRNVAGAVNALTSAQLAMAGITSAIPVDEVIDAIIADSDLIYRLFSFSLCHTSSNFLILTFLKKGK
jgi:hypothetical protein